jgi:hypothetical protein
MHQRHDPKIGQKEKPGGFESTIGELALASMKQRLDSEPFTRAHDVAQKRRLPAVSPLDPDRSRHHAVQTIRGVTFAEYGCLGRHLYHDA